MAKEWNTLLLEGLIKGAGDGDVRAGIFRIVDGAPVCATTAPRPFTATALEVKNAIALFLNSSVPIESIAFGGERLLVGKDTADPRRERRTTRRVVPKDFLAAASFRATATGHATLLLMKAAQCVIVVNCRRMPCSPIYLPGWGSIVSEPKIMNAAARLVDKLV